MTGKGNTAENPQVEVLTLKYDLPSLPTAQHKAGLAGLVLMIRTMKMRKMADVPEITELNGNGASFRFTRDAMQAVFDDLYAASWVEVESASKWQGKEPKRVDEKVIAGQDGKTKKEKRFIYDAVQPDGKFFETIYPPESGAWLKLWRDMLWNTLRGKPLTRKVYEDRAEGKTSAVAPDMWKEIVKEAEKVAASKPYAISVASSLFIGAQDMSAEKVPFQGGPSQNFLLHFWPIAAVYFAPMAFDAKGESKDKGFVFVVPEPSALDSFVDDALDYFRQLKTEVFGYRPKASRIDLPAEGGLEYLHNLTLGRLKKNALVESLAAVEVFHLEKRGNNVHTLAAERILPNPRVIKEYELLREQCRNPIFKSRRIRNLLGNNSWHQGMDADFAVWPWEFFIWSKGKSPMRIPFFGKDAKTRFEAIIKHTETLKTMKGGLPMTEQDWDDMLAKRIYGLIQNYVNRRAEEKSGKKFSDFKEQKDDKGRVRYPEEYLEAREKISSDAFLAMRGRRDKDFVEYFTGTVCSVPQFLPEDAFVDVSRALTTDWDKVKTLSMLALSACSWKRADTNPEKGE